MLKPADSEEISHSPADRLKPHLIPHDIALLRLGDLLNRLSVFTFREEKHLRLVLSYLELSEQSHILRTRKIVVDYHNIEVSLRDSLL
jgi:hypothetical protein